MSIILPIHLVSKEVEEKTGIRLENNKLYIPASNGVVTLSFNYKTCSFTDIYDDDAINFNPNNCYIVKGHGGSRYHIKIKIYSIREDNDYTNDLFVISVTYREQASILYNILCEIFDQYLKG